MRTQIAKTEYLPAEYIPPTFSTRTPSPYSAGWRWGLLSRNIFSNFIFLILSRNLVNGFLRLNNFFIFSDFVIILVWFWLSDYRLIISIFNLLILTRFGYSWLSSSTRLCFALCLLVYDSLIRFWISTRINFDLFQHCLLYTLTLQLFNSSACYKQTSMLMIVWFMLVLAILRLSDVFSFVLGVVYRLGLK